MMTQCTEHRQTRQFSSTVQKTAVAQTPVVGKLSHHIIVSLRFIMNKHKNESSCIYIKIKNSNYIIVRCI